MIKPHGDPRLPDRRSALLSARGFIGSTALNQPAPCPPSCCRRFRRAGPIRPRARRRCKARGRSEEHTSELQSLMRISYAVFCLKKKKNKDTDSIRYSIQRSETDE